MVDAGAGALWTVVQICYINCVCGWNLPTAAVRTGSARALPPQACIRGCDVCWLCAPGAVWLLWSDAVCGHCQVVARCSRCLIFSECFLPKRFQEVTKTLMEGPEGQPKTKNWDRLGRWQLCCCGSQPGVVVQQLYDLRVDSDTCC
jgi:hypothetical protein